MNNLNVLAPDVVAARLGVAKSTVWAMVARGDFPAPLTVTGRKRGWLSSEVDAWLAERAASRPVTPAPTPARNMSYWQAVKAGLRPHPRTVGRLRREAALASVEGSRTELDRAAPMSVGATAPPDGAVTRAVTRRAPDDRPT